MTPSPDKACVTGKDAFLYACPMLFNYKTLYQQIVDLVSKAYVGGLGRFRN